ncbi:DUF7544 domain-containing protein [Methanococcoides burtonii]|uniref:Uncharacterized protein n=1 Tax=Methanococcoides burtonii (strain DSM 6242 / NBRC 107633 / OCM 468 / ACE-M) TaxID=259564 RepID=Q12UP6_METBU|nr:hypothetical protein [Methanococcoides burtonii]ABE52830.1 Hypothetical protein Mbur_1949 [Methanococcoides burtonii DSM 6242]
MSWFVVDAVDVAFKRTRVALLEPFAIWKWIKLAIIIALASGGGGQGYNGPSSNSDFQDTSSLPFSEIPTLSSFIDQISIPDISWVIAAFIIILVLVLLFGYFASVMDLVLVESVTKNDVRFREYSAKFLRMGLDLFIVRLVLRIVYLGIFLMAALPLIMQIVHNPSTNLLPLLIASSPSLIVVIIALSIISSIINSFIVLCIPIAMYSYTGFIESLERVIANFRRDWKQMFVYWLGRMVLWALGSIAVVILVLVLILIPILLFSIIDAVIYFVLSMIIGEAAWIIIAPIAFIEIILLMLISIMGAVPLRVFMKYHMLTFIEKWDPEMNIPLFDVLENSEE